MADVGVPLPPSRSILPGRKRNPDTLAGRIRALQVGESMYVDKPQPIVSANAHAQVVNGRAPKGAEYTTRREGDGCRIWRTA